jgi:hypothetical protein
LSGFPVPNPITGLPVFGIVPKLRLFGNDLSEAPILLPLGRHIGPNRGYGVRHIWAEHQVEMHRIGLMTEADVPHYVLSIVKTGTPLYFEGSSWRQTRLMAVRSETGTAVVEFRDRREGSVWTVVTAFSGTKTHGTRVGTVR